MQVNITHNVAAAISLLDRLRPRFELALAKALTFTAQAVQEEETAELKRSLDNPTDFTVRSIAKQAATPQRPEARVYYRPIAARYLVHQVSGGDRAFKAFEGRLLGAGVLHPGWKIVPGRAAQLNAHGNVDRRQLGDILGHLRIAGSQRRNLSTDRKRRIRSTAKAGGQYFAVPGTAPRGKLRPGIYQRDDSLAGGRRPKVVFLFVPNVSYRPRYPFMQTATRTATRAFPLKFAAAMQRELQVAGARA